MADSLPVRDQPDKAVRRKKDLPSGSISLLMMSYSRTRCGSCKRAGKSPSGYLHVLQEWLEHVEQPLDEVFRRPLPPPIPKEDTSFRTSWLLQASHQTSFSLPMGTSDSKRFPQVRQRNS
jgi:hypothetical protein